MLKKLEEFGRNILDNFSKICENFKKMLKKIREKFQEIFQEF